MDDRLGEMEAAGELGHTEVAVRLEEGVEDGGDAAHRRGRRGVPRSGTVFQMIHRALLYRSGPAPSPEMSTATDGFGILDGRLPRAPEHGLALGGRALELVDGAAHLRD